MIRLASRILTSLICIMGVWLGNDRAGAETKYGLERINSYRNPRAIAWERESAEAVGAYRFIAETAWDSSSTPETPNTIGENCFDLFIADASGHEWVNAYLLALASHYNYPEQLDVSSSEDTKGFEKRFKELFIPWGIDTFEFLYGSGPTFDTELVVMSKSEGAFVIVVFRGSENLLKGPVSAFKDGILTDANYQLKDVPEFLGDGVEVHAGFWNAFVPIKDGVIETIERQGGFSQSKKLWITGNSLGAALANLCAIWLRKQNYSVQGVYTYGAPRCGNDRFRESYENDFSIMCQRWVNDNDLVPMLPPRGLVPDYCHVGITNNIKKDGSVVFNDVEREGIGNPLNHYQELYLLHIYHSLPSDIRNKMPVPPPLPPLVRPFH